MTNFVANAGSGGSTFTSDTEGGAEVPVVKIMWGAAGSGTRPTDASGSALPVDILRTPAATTGAITTAATTVGPVTMGDFDGLSVVVSGTYAGVNFGFWGSNDNTIWFPVTGVRSDSGVAEITTGVLTANQTRAWDISIGEALYFRVVSTAFTSGSAAISIVPGMMAAEPFVGAVAHGLYNTTLPTYTAGSLAALLADVNGRLTVTGQGAAAAAIAGNPFRIGGTFTTTLPTYTTTQQTDLQTTARGEVLVALSSGATAVAVKAASTASAFTDPALAVSIRPGDAMLTASAALADALANPTLGRMAVLNAVYNGTTWDLQRGMSGNLTTGDTGAKTATGNGATIANVGNKGVMIVVNMGTVSGTTPTCVIKVQGSVDGTNFVDIPGATTASLTATGLYGITVFPGAAVTAGVATTGTQAVASQVLPRAWRVVWTIAGTTPSFTITSVSYNYLPY